MNYYSRRKQAVNDIEALHKAGKSIEEIKLEVAKRYGLGEKVVNETLELLYLVKHQGKSKTKAKKSKRKR